MKTRNKKHKFKNNTKKKLKNKTKNKFKSNTIKHLNIKKKYLELNNKRSLSRSKRSFSPSINKNLVSLKSIKPSNIFECNDIVKTNIGNKCLDFSSRLVKKKMLNNLKASKHLNCSKFIAPKQYKSNCWFNTMFVTFFYSDKGRKFFRFFRQLMILGKKVNGDKIPEDLAKVFFILNKIIEAGYNQDYNENKKLIYTYDTNFFIENIYNIFIKKNIQVFNKNESGNPIEYYKSIVKYLNYNAINIINLDINRFNIDLISKRLNYTVDKFPHILILEIIDQDSKNINNKDTIINLKDKDNIIHKYILDSAIIRDKERQHFCSVLTCNGEELSFDGASHSRLNSFKWKKYLNKNKNWGFKGHTLKWNFMSGYQMLFYYKI
tara:strand:- start:333 stop:1466 length:1134 start_codon:yes stop_codon:yes gene_type:complete